MAFSRGFGSNNINPFCSNVARMTAIKSRVLMALAITLGIPCSIESFPLTTSLATKSFFKHDSLARFMIPTARCARGTSRVMMAGFGGKPKEKPQATGARKGQRSYERQVRSYKGLRAAGAEGLDVYVHRVGGDDMFIFAGKVAWSSEVSAEQSLQWQRDLIIDHIKVIEPRWNTKPPPQMRIFTAPLNTEIDVARNQIDLTRALGGKDKAGVSTEGVRSELVGFSPEMYEKGQDYYYVRKLDDGRCPAPPAEVKIESMDSLKAAGVDIDGGSPPAAGAKAE